MELLLAITVGVLTASGIWLMLRARSFDVILGLTLLSYAVNVMLFAMGSLAYAKPPILIDGVAGNLQNYTDPLPQALVLTAIVIGFAMTALVLVIALKSRRLNDSDHIDAEEEIVEDDGRGDA